MNCSKCNEPIPDGTNLCPKCGAALSASPSVPGENTQKLGFWQKLFQKRLARIDYWLLVLILNFIFGVLYSAAQMFFILVLPNIMLYWIFILVIYLCIFMVNMNLTIKRLHDTNRSSCHFLLAFLPIIGWLILLVYELLPGTEGPNRYGEPPQRIFLK